MWKGTVIRTCIKGTNVHNGVALAARKGASVHFWMRASKEGPGKVDAWPPGAARGASVHFWMKASKEGPGKVDAWPPGGGQGRSENESARVLSRPEARVCGKVLLSALAQRAPASRTKSRWPPGRGQRPLLDEGF